MKIQLVPATTPVTRPLQSDTEIARLLSLHQYLSISTGGALPSKLDVSKVKRVLDIGCGIGAWVHEVARNYPHMHVVGIDNNPDLITYARASTYVLPNATFLQQDMHTLEAVFEHRSFDLIHLRFLAGTVSVTQFPQLIQSVSRLCKRRSLILSTEIELPLTSSSGCDYMSSLILSAIIAKGLAFSPAFTPQLGITSRMRYWLRSQRCILKHDNTRYLDISFGTPAHALFVEQTTTILHRLRPFILSASYITEPELDDLLQRLQQEITARQFYGVCPLHTIVAFNDVLH